MLRCLISRVAGTGSNPAFPVVFFFQSSHTSDLKIGTLVATLPGFWHYRLSPGYWLDWCQYTMTDVAYWISATSTSVGNTYNFLSRSIRVIHKYVAEALSKQPANRHKGPSPALPEMYQTQVLSSTDCLFLDCSMSPATCKAFLRDQSAKQTSHAVSQRQKLQI